MSDVFDAVDPTPGYRYDTERGRWVPDVVNGRGASMVRTTTIHWRKVNVSADTTTYGASCIGHGLNSARCGASVAWCRDWQTSEMAAPAFWYYCDEHAHAAATDDGMALEPNAPGFADSPPAAVPSAQLEPELRWTPEPEPNPYAVGSIFHTSWGYDQTNVEYYVVVRETKASVWLARCADVVIDGRLYPDEDHVDGTSTMHRKGKHGPYVRMDYVRHAYPYNGGGCYDTYAAGGAGH